MARDAATRLYDVVILGNGSAAAGAVAGFRRHLAVHPDARLSVLVLEAATEAQVATRMPEYNARVSFPDDLQAVLPDAAQTAITWYERVAYYSHRTRVKKPLPPHKVALVDVDRLVADAEAALPPEIVVRHHKQAYDARYVGDGADEVIELRVQYPFGDEKVFEETDRYRARVVIDCSGTGSLLLDTMQGYRHDSSVVCGVLAFKVIGATLRDAHEVSLGLDDSITHGAGSWAYPNDRLSPALGAYLDEWFRTTRNRRVRELIAGKGVEDFVGTIADVGISSIAPYARAQHYQHNLERQVDDLFQRMPGYREMFTGAAVIPGSAYFKPSPVLQPVAEMAGRRYLLAGDAAGHATPYIGEGVRPGVVMGAAAAEVALHALASGDFAAATLRREYEDVWWRRFGHYDLWSDLFRHFSSTCFADDDWDDFFTRLERLSPEEFYAVLRSEYSAAIVLKMFPARMIPHYLRFRCLEAVDLVRRRLTLRQAASWVR